MTSLPVKPGVVSDTGPVNSLLQIEVIDLLPKFAGYVGLPRALVAELTNRAAPTIVRSWMARVPECFLIQEPSSLLESVVGGAGERAAIARAREHQTPLLRDDEAARRSARREGLLVSGTLGILQQAHSRKLIDIVPVMETLLHSTDFHISDMLA